MSVLDNRSLWQLAQVDNAILAIKKRAAAMDMDRLAKQYQQLEADAQTKSKALHDLHAEQSNIRLEIESTKDKHARIEKDLYSGRISSPKEIELHEKELTALLAQIEKLHEKLSALVPTVEQATEAANSAEEKLQKGKRALQEFKKKLMSEKEQMETEYKRLQQVRPTLVPKIPAGLIARYEAIRKKEGGIGMTEVNGKNCAACGMHLAEKLIESAREGRAVTCENCHRLLYASEGII